MDVETKYIIALIIIFVGGAFLSKLANGNIGSNGGGGNKKSSSNSSSSSDSSISSESK